MIQSTRLAKSSDFEKFRGKQTVIRMCSPEVADRTGEGTTRHVIRVVVPDGDVIETLRFIQEEGGMFSVNPDGSILHLPWPCAVVEIFLDDGA